MSELPDCAFDGCEKPIKNRKSGLCAGHYEQRRLGKPLTPLRRWTQLPVVAGRRECSNCSELRLFPQDFYSYSSSDGKVRYHTQCKECAKEARREYDKQNPRDPEMELKVQLRYRYGLDLEQYYLMLEEQGGGCNLCGKTPEENGKRLAVDHDHSCCAGERSCGECVRALLCTSCNQGIGMLNDDPDLMRKAASYIESYKTPALKTAA